MSKKDLPDLEKLFDGFEDVANATVFDNVHYFGFDIAWSLKGKGFGHVTFSFSKKENKWKSDTERMNVEEVAKILSMASSSLAKLLVDRDEELTA